MSDEIKKNPNKGVEKLLVTTNKTVFTTSDLNKIWQLANYRSLIRKINYYSKKGKLKKIKRGVYSIPERPVNEIELANKLRSPSYISFETALHNEGIIFQWDKRITLASKASESININGATTLFRKIKEEILLNSKGIKKENNYFIADKERALLDMIYINPKFSFDNLRSVDFKKCRNYLSIYKRKSLEKKVSKLEKYAESY